MTRRRSRVQNPLASFLGCPGASHCENGFSVVLALFYWLMPRLGSYLSMPRELSPQNPGSCWRRSPRSAREGGHRQTGKACPFEALVNPGRPRPPQTTRRGHRVAEQLLGAHRRPFWARSGGKVLGAFGGDPSKLDDLPKYLLLHDVHTRPVRAPPTGLAADIPSGGLELELLQEIPVI